MRWRRLIVPVVAGLALVWSLGGMTGCGDKPDTSTPEATINSFLRAASDGRVDVMKQLMTAALRTRLTKAAPRDQGFMPLVAVALGKRRVGPAKVTGSKAVVAITVDRDIALNQLSRVLEEQADKLGLKDKNKRRRLSLQIGSKFLPRYRLELTKQGAKWLVSDWRGQRG
ncbi:MAG: hypothetical protein KJ621_07985 [Proteobacteria bacterium]|nr:hypothetical protein [Pseudomonadota bacterium]MBU1741473.1 hypothetical protein [Pseudomonadota bacterium]